MNYKIESGRRCLKCHCKLGDLLYAPLVRRCNNCEGLCINVGCTNPEAPPLTFNGIKQPKGLRRCDECFDKFCEQIRPKDVSLPYIGAPLHDETKNCWVGYSISTCLMIACVVLMLWLTCK